MKLIAVMRSFYQRSENITPLILGVEERQHSQHLKGRLVEQTSSYSIRGHTYCSLYTGIRAWMHFL